MQTELFFAIPGNLENRTGGYAYDRRIFQELTALGLHCTVIELDSSFPFPSAAALAEAEHKFSALPVDSIVIVDGLAFGALPESARRHCQRLRLIALCHHPLALETGLSDEQANALRLSEKISLDCARAIIVTSPATAQTLKTQFAIDSAKITIAVPGTDRVDFAKCEGAVPVLLTVATLTKRKGHDVLIDALQGLSHLPWTARFAGGAHYDPAWAKYLQNKVCGAGLADRIEFLGALDDLSAEYQQADLFVLPSRYEGYGMVYAEAIAHGLPVVATQCGAATTLIPHTAGRIIPVADHDALTQALRELLSDSTLRAQLQKGAQQAAGQLPQWQHSAQIIQQLIFKIAQ